MAFSTRPEPEPTGPGEESVWDYPRPPRLEPVHARLRVVFAGETIAETTSGHRVLETSHPPNYYFPPDDVRADALHASAHVSFCEWKGRATYYDVVVAQHVAERAAWVYESASAAFAAIRGHVAFYAAPMDECSVDGEVVMAQPGGFYGGWITSHIRGPFKGGPGSRGW